MHSTKVVRKRSTSFSRLALISLCATNSALISSRKISKAITSTFKSKHDVQEITPEEASTSCKESEAQEVWQATSAKEQQLGLHLISSILALACSRSATQVLWTNLSSSNLAFKESQQTYGREAIECTKETSCLAAS